MTTQPPPGFRPYDPNRDDERDAFVPLNAYGVTVADVDDADGEPMTIGESQAAEAKMLAEAKRIARWSVGEPVAVNGITEAIEAQAKADRHNVDISTGKEPEPSYALASTTTPALALILRDAANALFAGPCPDVVAVRGGFSPSCLQRERDRPLTKAERERAGGGSVRGFHLYDASRMCRACGAYWHAECAALLVEEARAHGVKLLAGENEPTPVKK
jgi:hypothetical protein